MQKRTRYRVGNRQGSGDTTLELRKLIGRKADYRVKDLCIEVEILDTRYTWGQVHYLITPVSGSGNQWVASGLTLHD